MNRLSPQWIVSDLEDSLDFYQKTLGFEVEWQGSLFAIIRHQEVTLMLRQLKKEGLARPNRHPFVQAGWHTAGAEAWDAYIWVNEVESLYDQFAEQGGTAIRGLEQTDYGNLEFEIEDPDGYILCFGQAL
jgi:catechol 2,3-dioxygenase-like lactoylglutathione lyase family enzyme